MHLISAFILVFSFSGYSYAAGSCSPYIGQATLNEFFKDQSNQSIDADDFSEVKILNDTITQATYETWTINICEKDANGNNNDADGCSNNLSINKFTDKSKPWLVYKNGAIGSDIDIGKHINLKTSFDATLLDGNGDLIDYLTVDGYSNAITGISCDLSNLVFDYQVSIPGVNDKTIYRSPDGTGDWAGAPAATAPSTEDTTNDNLPTPPAGETYPIVTINNINVDIGGNAVFTVSLADASGASTTFSQAVKVSYYTQDGTATVADGDYTSVPLTGTPSTVTIAAGQTSTTITIASPSSNYADIGEIFYAVLNAVENSAANGGEPNATISKHFGEAKLDGSGCSISTTGIIGGKEIDVKENDITFNNGTSTATLTEGKKTTENSIILNGSIVNQPISLPKLDDITFETAATKTLSDGDTLTPATNYGLISVERNSTITLSTGTYNINQFIFAGGVTINVTGAVIINTNEFIYKDDGDDPKIDGKATINDGGNISDLTINIYGGEGAEFDLGNDSKFTGVVYSSFSNTKFEIDDRNTFTGGLFTAGEIELKETSSIIYNNAARSASFSVLGCLPIRTIPTVTTQINASSTPTIKGTYDSSDAAGGFTITVAGTTYTLGSSSQLTTSGNNWTLTITTPITTGTYNVVATSTNGSGNVVSDTTTNELTVGAGSCFSDSYPFFSDKELNIKDDDISFTYNGTTTTLTEDKTANGAINTSGVTSIQSTTLPTLSPITFVDTPNKSLSDGGKLSPTDATPQGKFNLVTIANNAEVTISAGTYEIDQFHIGKGATIIVDGAVIINTNEFIYSGGGDGNITINDGGDPANFIVNIYNGQDAEFDIEDGSKFTGIIYSSFSDTKIEIDEDNTFTGAIFTNGNLEIKKGSSIIFTDKAKIAAAAKLGCSSVSIDHFSINYSAATGTGINCQAENITIEAHNTSHTVVTDHTGLINLTTSTSNGDWSKTVTTADANGTFTAGTADSGTASYTFVTADNGSIILSFRDINAEVVNLNVSGSSLTEISNSAVANDDYAIDFKSSGFIYTIPTQISCATSADITIQAVRTDETTKLCVSAFKNKGRKLKVWASYDSPAAAAISGSPSVSMINGIGTYSLPSTEPVSANVDMTFSDNADETFTITYPDAGRLILKTKYEGSAANSDTGLTMLGSTTFVVKPAKLYVYSDDTNASCVSGDPTNLDCNPAFKKTGENFNLKIRGACASNAVTPNFQLDGLTVSSNLVAPTSAGSINANLAVTSFNIADADNGEHVISTQNVDQVGIFTFTAKLPAAGYLGETIIGTTTLNTSANIGRFTPDHFDTLVTHGCSGAGNFTYSGQAFTVTASARNQNGAITLNYRNSFAFGVTLSDANPAATPTGSFTNNIVSEPSFTSTTATDGSSTGVGTTSTILYTFANKYTIPDTLEIRATDIKDTTISSNGFAEGSTDIRSGRARLENVYGSELTALTMRLNIEFYSDNATPADLTDDGFVLNTDDSCTTYDATSGTLANYTGNLATGETTVTGAVTESNGLANITFSAPGVGNDGSVNLLADNISSWLTYPWGIDCDGDTVNDTGACGTASFGLYRGDDRIIYWREVFQ